MLKIIQISDLHYGDSKFKKELLINVVNYINEEKPDFVACTGDITDHSFEKEFKRIHKYLNNIESPLICVPGNHDWTRENMQHYREYFGHERTEATKNGTIILGLCSPRQDESEGELGEEQLAWIIKTFKENPEKNRILLLHHHMIDVPYAGIKKTKLLDSGKALEIARIYKVSLVLMGHRHVPHVIPVSDMNHITNLIYCGTTTTTKVKAGDNPCFNQIILDDKNIKVYTINSRNTEDKELIYHVEKGIIKKIKHRDNGLEDLLTDKFCQKRKL